VETSRVNKVRKFINGTPFIISYFIVIIIVLFCVNGCATSESRFCKNYCVNKFEHMKSTVTFYRTSHSIDYHLSNNGDHCVCVIKVKLSEDTK
jgi:hypothetical protein